MNMSAVPIETIMRLGPVMPVVTITDVRQAVPLAQALVAGGVHATEVTLRTPCALEAIRIIAAEVREAMVGAGSGSWLTPADALAGGDWDRIRLLALATAGLRQAHPFS